MDENKNKKSGIGATVIKHSAAISISNEVTLVQRKSWNLLLANAYKDLADKNVTQFSIPLTLLAEKLEYSAKNTTYLKDNIRALADVKVEYDLLGKSGAHEEWGIEHILVSPKIANGNLYYELPWSLRKKLYNPRVYAKINLLLQNLFSSKYALALYELCVDYYRIKEGRGDTGYITVDMWRKLLGVADGEYKRFKDFNGYVIRNSLKEINAKSDLYAEPVYKRKARKVEFFKLLITKNKKTKLEIIPPIDGGNENKQLDLLQFMKKSSPVLLKKLLTYGVDKETASEAISEKSEEEILSILDYVQERKKAGKIKSNPGGYLASLLRGDFQKPTPAEPATKSIPVKEGDIVSYQGKQCIVDGSGMLRDAAGNVVLAIGQLQEALKNKTATFVTSTLP